MLLDDIEKNYPFISVVEYGGHEYVGVINNQDTAITSMFIFTDIPNAKSKEKFIELCKTWWFESNRMIPQNTYVVKYHIVMYIRIITRGSSKSVLFDK